MSNEPQTREWLSPHDLADEWSLPVQTIYSWRVRGTGPRGVTIGRHVRYRRSEIERWLAEQADPRPVR
jgi:predicted DNA-binding transcriptional regulator AlpA